MHRYVNDDPNCPLIVQLESHLVCTRAIMTYALFMLGRVPVLNGRQREVVECVTNYIEKDFHDGSPKFLLGLSVGCFC